MHWLIISILATMAFALTQVFDSYYANGIFKHHLVSSIFYGHILKSVLVGILFVIFVRTGFPLELLPYFVLVALIEIAYLFPYFKTLRNADTSIAATLFPLSGALVPLLAFLTIGEVLSFYQYAGFFVIISSTFLLNLNARSAYPVTRPSGHNLDYKKKFVWNISILYMLIAAVLLTIQAIIQKHIFENIDWLAGFSWSFLFIGLATSSLLFSKKYRTAIRADYGDFKKKYYVVSGNVLLSLGAWAAFTYAISFTDISLVKGIEGAEPFFVMLYALIFKGKFQAIFKERTDRKNVLKKTLLFGLLIIGIVLMT